MRLRDLPNITLKSLFAVLNAMYPQKVNTKQQVRDKVRAYREAGTPAEEIMRTVNQHTEALNEMIRGSKRDRSPSFEETIESKKATPVHDMTDNAMDASVMK